MSFALPSHFSTYRRGSNKPPVFSGRRTCTACNQPRDMHGGALLPVPGSRRKKWVCSSCKPGNTAAAPVPQSAPGGTGQQEHSAAATAANSHP